MRLTELLFKMTRFFDILLSVVGLIILFPLFIVISIWIIFDSKGPAFFKQSRVGRYDVDFILIKFRSMRLHSFKQGSLTIGERDPRITNSGYILRRFKIDELPQLINVLKGEMSFVGPRPEVRKYVNLYNEEQRKVLLVRPGITDVASIEFRSENEILAKSSNPERIYISEILPAKLKLNSIYCNNPSLHNYFKIIFKTIFSIFKQKVTPE